jgi:hypothetical protein
MRKIWVIALCTLLASSGNPYAQTTKPSELDGVIRAAAPYSEGTYTYYVMKIYDASLWTDADTWSMQAPFALSLHYSIDIDKKILVDKTVEQMDDNAPLAAADAAVYHAILDNIYTPIKEGDTVTAIFVPDKDLRLYHNGQLTGTVRNMAFNKRFFDIWLSDRTTATSLRRQLLKLPQ